MCEYLAKDVATVGPCLRTLCAAKVHPVLGLILESEGCLGPPSSLEHLSGPLTSEECLARLLGIFDNGIIAIRPLMKGNIGNNNKALRSLHSQTWNAL